MPIRHLAAYKLMDLGVADINRDGRLDVFTTNHNQQESILLNRANGFWDQTTSMGLDQDVSFPGWSDVVTPVLIDAPGLYIHRTVNEVIAEWNAPDGAESVSGRLEFYTTVTVTEATNVFVAITETPSPVAPVLTTVEFSAVGDARLEIAPELGGLPVNVALGERLPPKQVFVGPRLVSPTGSEFTLRVRDRHGMAWADFDGDSDVDVFVARGGIQGQIGAYTALIQDELQTNTQVQFADSIAGSGILKGDCRGRDVDWIDLDDDNRLDLFLWCEDSTPQLYHQEAGGDFTEVTDAMTADAVVGKTYAWVDVDLDAKAELVTAERGTIRVYDHAGLQPLTLTQTVPLATLGGLPKQLAIADYDADGDPDLYVASPKGAGLIVNEGGYLTGLPVDAVGLPATAMAASWVDVDNDGLTDLHTIPDGLFMQQPDGTFVDAGIGDLRFLPASQGAASWFDFDNDGARDLLSVTRVHDDGRARFLRNVMTTGHWLEVDLIGRQGNQEAIGAVVRVDSGDRVQTQWVGQNDGSLFSQGHYRLYFGLGEVANAETVEVVWPDGSVQALGRPAGDELVVITQAT